ncbi:hypothetical protein [Mycobacterium sp.]|uniref:hypothetical protein n=1 Tax=Mycobacterium sp. TaxID=1785 RepID=UPI003C7392C8
MGDAGLVPRFAQLPGWDPFRSRERLNALWSAAAVPSVTGGAAIAYRTLFQTLRRLVVGRTLTVRTNGNDLKLTVTEFDFRVEVRGLAVGQVGDVLLAAEDVGWREYRFEQAMAVLSNVHFRPGATSEIVAAPVELSLKLPAEVLEDLVAHASPQFIAHIDDDGVVRLRWARRPGWGHLEVDIRIVGTALWLQPRALVVGGRRLGLPARLPIYPVELPDLPNGLLITNVDVRPSCVLLYGLLPEWQMDLPLSRLEDIVSQLTARSGILNLARTAGLM